MNKINFIKIIFFLISSYFLFIFPLQSNPIKKPFNIYLSPRSRYATTNEIESLSSIGIQLASALHRNDTQKIQSILADLKNGISSGLLSLSDNLLFEWREYDLFMDSTNTIHIYMGEDNGSIIVFDAEKQNQRYLTPNQWNQYWIPKIKKITSNSTLLNQRQILTAAIDIKKLLDDFFTRLCSLPSVPYVALRSDQDPYLAINVMLESIIDNLSLRYPNKTVIINKLKEELEFWRDLRNFSAEGFQNAGEIKDTTLVYYDHLNKILQQIDPSLSMNEHNMPPYLNLALGFSA